MALKTKIINKNQCPKCGAVEFITEPNQYDVLRLNNGHFEIEHSEFCDEFKIFCRECSTEINEKVSEVKHKVIIS
ncbi:hypothetical protein COX74_00580 [bacterium (Candidatus Gribaldobacteria) CG_4_10_14_0_2_um_filter_41_16]|uniref:Uncharacterized protein n=1 Tax=bacterium (Candidatus Gribaldobacteria) CG_4_10_14_0_2_um_filter_41_16 TaxID=2014265 RepID=A0A2M7VJB8_9BACT|nr:MAG: hypothetical protein COX74_00580 [bacterium (Candidatus Gribaldobacteria) CG_4_10_14_0_2_um_filter_41_16]